MLYGLAEAGMVSRLGRLPPERVAFALNQLSKKDMVVRRGSSYGPTTAAIEAMALREHVRRGLIAALGAIIAKGKESDVYEAFDDEGRLYALKFFKLGRTSFTQVRKKRPLPRSETKSWISLNYEAARREYAALRRLAGLSPSFPKALAYNRSTVLLEELSGVRLSGRPELVDPRAVLGQILSAGRASFKAGLINGDLSEYNILTDGARVWLIDWPQSVGSSHPNASSLLSHDVLSVIRFFRRAYRISIDERKAVEYVSGRAASLE